MLSTSLSNEKAQLEDLDYGDWEALSYARRDMRLRHAAPPPSTAQGTSSKTTPVPAHVPVHALLAANLDDIQKAEAQGMIISRRGSFVEAGQRFGPSTSPSSRRSYPSPAAPYSTSLPCMNRESMVKRLEEVLDALGDDDSLAASRNGFTRDFKRLIDTASATVSRRQSIVSRRQSIMESHDDDDDDGEKSVRQLQDDVFRRSRDRRECGEPVDDGVMFDTREMFDSLESATSIEDMQKAALHSRRW